MEVQLKVEESYKIRYQVFCEELKFEPHNELKLEKDEFDDYSSFCLLKHKNNKRYAGTVRMITPRHVFQKLPIERFCPHIPIQSKLHPRHFKRTEICEISRLAICSEYRKSKLDQFVAFLGEESNKLVFNGDFYSSTLAVLGLYIAATAQAINVGIKHIYVIIEPKLARSLSFLGVSLIQLGDVFEHHGQRAPYYLNAEKCGELLESVMSEFLN